MLASSAIISINVAKCDVSDNSELYSHGSRYLVIYPKASQTHFIDFCSKLYSCQLEVLNYSCIWVCDI